MIVLANVLLAYFDPGSGSLLMQTIFGGTRGLIVLVHYLWQNRIRWWQRPDATTIVRSSNLRSSDETSNNS